MTKIFWLTEYGDDSEGWQPTYYSEHITQAAAELYCSQIRTLVDGDLRISEVTVKRVKTIKRP